MNDDMLKVNVADNSSSLLQLSKEYICNMSFESEDDAFLFYNNYAYAIGFSIRKDTVHREKRTRRVKDRLFVCSCEGSRKKVYLEMVNRQREHRPLTRCNCTARLRIKLNKANMRYFVATFIEEHNHDLLPMHKDEALGVPNPVIRLNRMINLFNPDSGGEQSVGFNRKDLYNNVNHDPQEEISHGDAEVAFAYLYGKSECDPMFFFQHTFDVDNRLDKLFWADGRSRYEFAVFGDVLVVDRTYKTNAYKFPLVILAGVNNHRNTCIFGAALVQNQNMESYIWVLKTFMSAMNHKRPLSVVTDADKTMQAAIVEVFPDVRQRLCKWHLQRNAILNVRMDNFNGLLSRHMSLKCSTDVFEDAWKKMIVQYGLENHKWIEEVYEKRQMWSEAYLCGHFFGLVKSTKCCEDMNAFLNRFLGSNRKLADFLRDYHRGLECIRIDVLNQEVKTNYSKPVLTTPLRGLEDHASKVYTREVFRKVKKQIELQGMLWHKQVIPHSVGSHTYVIAEYNNEGLLSHVLFEKEGMHLMCDCKRFESSGILCKHMIYVLKCEGLKEIPASCINKRWTVDINNSFWDKYLLSLPTDEVEIARYSYITSKCNEMGIYAKQTNQGYREVIDGIIRLSARAKDLWMMDLNGCADEAESSQPVVFEFDVLDLKKVNLKGSRKRTKKSEYQDTNVNIFLGGLNDYGSNLSNLFPCGVG